MDGLELSPAPAHQENGAELTIDVGDVDLSELENPTLRRLIEDVRNEPDGVAVAAKHYNRQHNRHNR
jgi:hypothetical protein